MVSDTPEPILTPAWQMLRGQVLHNAEFGASVQVICGAEGAGKTTFLRLLSQAASGEWLTLTAEPGAPDGALLRRLLMELGQRPPADARTGELISALRSFAQSLEKAERRTVVAIDDAHLMSPGELAALISVLQGNRAEGYGLHFIFLAQPGLAEQIDELQLLDVAVHDEFLPAFAPGEIESLLQRTADARGLELARGQSEARWQAAAGLPGAALRGLESAPKAAPASPAQEPASAAAPRRRALPPMGHVAALVVLLGILMWAMFAPPPEDAPAPRLPEPGALPEAQQPAAAPAAAVEAPAPAQIVTDTAPPPPPPRSEPPPAAAPATLPGEAQPAADPRPTAAQPPPTVAPAPVAPPAQTAPPAPTAAPAATELDVDASEQYLQRLAPEGYVLQILATSSLPQLQTFWQAQPNRANLSVHRGLRGTQLLYIMVEGFYADLESARAAAANLPPSQRQGGAFPKTVKQVRAEIAAAARR